MSAGEVQCGVCGEKKSPEHFYLRQPPPKKATTCPYDRRCKECRRPHFAKLERARRKTPEGKASAKAATKRWHVKNPTYERERTRRRLQESPKYREIVRAGGRKWAKAHPEYARDNMHRRRVIRREGDFDPKGWNALVALFGRVCAYCGIAAPLQIEHVVPVVAGGRHDRNNIVPACSRCNKRKHSRPLDLFLTEEQVDLFIAKIRNIHETQGISCL